MELSIDNATYRTSPIFDDILKRQLCRNLLVGGLGLFELMGSLKVRHCHVLGRSRQIVVYSLLHGKTRRRVFVSKLSMHLCFGGK